MGAVIVVEQIGLVVGDLGVMIGRVATVAGAEQIGTDVGAVSVTDTAFDAVCRCVCADDLVEEALRPLLGRPATGPEIDAAGVLVVSLIVSFFFRKPLLCVLFGLELHPNVCQFLAKLTRQRRLMPRVQGVDIQQAMLFRGARKNPWDRPERVDHDTRGRRINVGDPLVDVSPAGHAEVDADLGKRADNVVGGGGLVE